MRYVIARVVFNIMKWLWLAFLAVFAVTYAANIAPLPFKQVTGQFYDSTFGMLFLPGLHLILTLTILGALALLTLISWLIARRAPEEKQECDFPHNLTSFLKHKLATKDHHAYFQREQTMNALKDNLTTSLIYEA